MKGVRTMEFFVFLPQMRMSPDTLVERAQAVRDALTD
jgi:hypothetical protein